MGKAKNIFEEIGSKTHGEDWRPVGQGKPTEYTPGSDDKIMLMRRRLENGQSLWADGDTTCFDEQIGAYITAE